MPGKELSPVNTSQDTRSAVAAASNELIEAKKHVQNGNGGAGAWQKEAMKKLLSIIVNDPGALDALRKLQNGQEM